MSGPKQAAPSYVWVMTCPKCGKRCFRSRKDAKRAIRQHRDPGGRRMGAYQCGDYWHMGHLPAAVRKGMAGRDALGGAA